MAINKIINVNDGSGRSFEENTIAELKFDTKPEVGSFNAVTSDAVARAVAGASGEVPEVTEGDNGKVLKAVYDAGGPAVEWGDAPSGVPPYTTSEDGKVLGVVDNSGSAELQWVAPATVDQTYDAGSTNAMSGVAVASAIANNIDQTYDSTSPLAQSGVAVAEAVGGVLPSITGQASKVLAVNSGATGLEWVTQQGGGGGGDTIAPYTLRFKFLDTSFDPSTSITGTSGTWTRVSSDPNIWDWTNESASWYGCFDNKSFSYYGSALIGSGDLSGVTSMSGMFKRVANLAYVKMGNFGATCVFREMFDSVNRVLNYVELGEPGDICYGDMYRMFAGYYTNCSLQVVFNGTLAATDMSYFAINNVGLEEAPRITVDLYGHSCINFSYAFKGCSNLKVCPQYTLGTDSTNWYQAFSGCKSLVAAPDLKLEYATNTAEMFSGCESLAYVPDYNVSNASVYGMFSGCRSLTKIPNLTGLSNKSSLNQLFEDCYGIQTGADTLYQQLSSQVAPLTSTTDTFKNCGAATVTGSAALATIPASWGGTGT